MEEEPEAGASFEDAGKAFITFRPGRPLGMKLDKASNAVQEVNGGQAEKAGVRVGWILKKVAGKPFTASMLKKALKGFEPVNCLFELPDDDFTKRIPKQSIDIAGEAHVWISTDLNQKGRKRGATSSKRTIEVKTSRKRGASTRTRAKTKPKVTRQSAMPKPQHKRARSEQSYTSSPSKSDRKIATMIKEFDVEKKQMQEDFERQLEELKQENAKLLASTGGDENQSELAKQLEELKAENEKLKESVSDDVGQQLQELKLENDQLKEQIAQKQKTKSPKEKGGDNLNDADLESEKTDTDMAEMIDDMDSVGKEKRMNAQLDELRKQDSIKLEQEKEKIAGEFEVEKEKMLHSFEEEKKQIVEEKNKLQEEFDIHVSLEQNLRKEIQEDLDRIHVLEEENAKLQEELTKAKSAQEIEKREIQSIKSEHEEEVNEFENDKWEMVEEFAEEREALRKEVEDVKKQLEEMRLKLVEQKQQNALAEDTQEDKPASMSQEDMEKMLTQHQNEKKIWEQNHEELKTKLSANHEEEKKKLVDAHEEVLTQMATSHENEKKELKRACQFLKESVEGHQQEKQEIHEAHSKEKQKLIDAHEVEVERIKREFEEEKIALSEAPDSIGDLQGGSVSIEEHENLKQQLGEERRKSMVLMEDIENAKNSAAKIQAEMVRQAQKAEREKTKEKTKELKRSKKIMVAGITQLIVPRTKELRNDYDAFKNEITEQHKQFLAALEEMQTSITAFK